MEELREVIDKIEKVDSGLANETQKRLDNLTKPQGSLGRLEELAKQIVEITQERSPRFKNKVIFTMAADHGVTEEKVSAFPKEVTAQMVYNFIRGGAGINVLAHHVEARVIVVDMGIAEKINPERNSVPGQKINFKDKKINYGTKNMAKEAAMSREEAIKSIKAGVEVFEEEFKAGIDVIGTGDMGIGNTTSSSAITAAITGKPIEELTGRGTGIDDKTLINKIRVIKKALKSNEPDPRDAVDILSKIGGFEIGGLAGVILSAAKNRIPVVIDGFISGAAALIAYKLQPNVKDYLLAAHCSVEKGHKIILEYLNLNPLLDLNLRLGEGTGAALGIGIIEAALKILTRMATFEHAEVSEKLK